MSFYISLSSYYDNIILVVVGIIIGYLIKSFSLKDIDLTSSTYNNDTIKPKIVKLSSFESSHNNNINSNNHHQSKQQQQQAQTINKSYNNDFNSADRHLTSNNHLASGSSSSSSSKSSKLNTTNNSIPQHIAVIMDGNRRYGKKVYGDALKGHWSGGQTLVDFIQWCMAEGVGTLSVYAFSTENWQRPVTEIDTLMAIFAKYIDTLLKEAVDKNVRVKILSTDRKRLPLDTQRGMTQLEECTRHCTGFTLNVAVSYGGRAELVDACVSVAGDIAAGRLAGVQDINEQVFASHLSTAGCSDPDLLIRTSGESRLSNFMPWQLAYTELVFVDKLWPELTREDLRTVLHMYSLRTRRFGV